MDSVSVKSKMGSFGNFYIFPWVGLSQTTSAGAYVFIAIRTSGGGFQIASGFIRQHPGSFLRHGKTYGKVFGKKPIPRWRPTLPRETQGILTQRRKYAKETGQAIGINAKRFRNYQYDPAR
jgi:hypothetical protein